MSIAVRCATALFPVVLAAADPAFAAPASYAAPNDALQIQLRSLTTGTKPALVTCGSGGIFYRLNDGSGGFGTEQNLVPFAGTVGSVLMNVDVDADTKKDLVFVTRESPRRIGIAWGTSISDLSLVDTANLTYIDAPTGGTINDVLAVKWRTGGDAGLDLVASDRTNETIVVWTQTADRAFAVPVTYALPTGSQPDVLLSTVLGRSDYADNILDILVACPGTGTVAVLTGNANGTLNSAVTTPAAPACRQLQMIGADGNGSYPSFIVATGGTNVTTLAATAEGNALVAQRSGTLPDPVVLGTTPVEVLRDPLGNSLHASAATDLRRLSLATNANGDLLFALDLGGDVSTFPADATARWNIELVSPDVQRHLYVHISASASEVRYSEDGGNTSESLGQLATVLRSGRQVSGTILAATLAGHVVVDAPMILGAFAEMWTGTSLAVWDSMVANGVLTIPSTTPTDPMQVRPWSAGRRALIPQTITVDGSSNDWTGESALVATDASGDQVPNAIGNAMDLLWARVTQTQNGKLAILIKTNGDVTTVTDPYWNIGLFWKGATAWQGLRIVNTSSGTVFRDEAGTFSWDLVTVVDGAFAKAGNYLEMTLPIAAMEAKGYVAGTPLTLSVHAEGGSTNGTHDSLLSVVDGLRLDASVPLGSTVVLGGQTEVLTTTGTLREARTGDIDGDKSADIVVLNAGLNAMAWIAGEGGKFIHDPFSTSDAADLGLDLPTPTGGGAQRNLRVVNLNDDSILDLAVLTNNGNSNPGVVSVFLGQPYVPPTVAGQTSVAVAWPQSGVTLPAGHSFPTGITVTGLPSGASITSVAYTVTLPDRSPDTRTQTSAWGPHWRTDWVPGTTEGQATAQVTVTYNDNSTDTASVNFIIGAPRAPRFALEALPKPANTVEARVEHLASGGQYAAGWISTSSGLEREAVIWTDLATTPTIAPIDPTPVIPVAVVAHYVRSVNNNGDVVGFAYGNERWSDTDADGFDDRRLVDVYLWARLGGTIRYVRQVQADVDLTADEDVVDWFSIGDNGLIVGQVGNSDLPLPRSWLWNGTTFVETDLTSAVQAGTGATPVAASAEAISPDGLIYGGGYGVDAVNGPFPPYVQRASGDWDIPGITNGWTEAITNAGDLIVRADIAGSEETWLVVGGAASQVAPLVTGNGVALRALNAQTDAVGELLYHDGDTWDLGDAAYRPAGGNLVPLHWLIDPVALDALGGSPGDGWHAHLWEGVGISDGSAPIIAANGYQGPYLLRGGNQPPLALIDGPLMDAPGATLAWTMVLADDQTAPADLTLSVLSVSEPGRIDAGAIAFGGSGANRTVTVPIRADATTGEVIVTVRVSDGVLHRDVERLVQVTGGGGGSILASIAVQDSANEEGDLLGAFRVTLSQPAPAGGLTISLTTGGLAAQGVDYILGAAVVPEGLNSVDVTVTISDDNDPELDEDVIVQLQVGAGYILGNPSQASFTIPRNDYAYWVQWIAKSTIDAAGDGTAVGAEWVDLVWWMEAAPGKTLTSAEFWWPGAAQSRPGRIEGGHLARMQSWEAWGVDGLTPGALQALMPNGAYRVVLHYTDSSTEERTDTFAWTAFPTYPVTPSLMHRQEGVPNGPGNQLSVAWTGTLTWTGLRVMNGPGTNDNVARDRFESEYLGTASPYVIPVELMQNQSYELELMRMSGNMGSINRLAFTTATAYPNFVTGSDDLLATVIGNIPDGVQNLTWRNPDGSHTTGTRTVTREAFAARQGTIAAVKVVDVFPSETWTNWYARDDANGLYALGETVQKDGQAGGHELTVPRLVVPGGAILATTWYEGESDAPATLTLTNDTSPSSGTTGCLLINWGDAGEQSWFKPGQGEVEYRETDAGGAYLAIFVGTPPTTEPPVFVNPPATITAWAGTTVNLQVNATGLPTPTFIWEKAESGTSTFTTYAGPMSFTAALADDGDQYRVTATNSSGSVQHTLTVIVQAATAPSFANGPTSSVSALVGGVIDLSAPVSGMPTPTVTWQKAEAGTGTFTTYAGPFAFMASQADDGDQYRVTATNPAGSAQHLITVSVALEPVMWSVQPSFMQVAEGQTAHVQVNRSMPGPATSITVVISGPVELQGGTWPTSVAFADNATQAIIDVPLADDAFTNVGPPRQVMVTIQPGSGNLGQSTTIIQVQDNEPAIGWAGLGIDRIRQGTATPTDPQVRVYVNIAPSSGQSFANATVIFPGTAEERPLRQHDDGNGGWGLGTWDLTQTDTLPLSQVNNVFPAGTYIIKGYVAGGGVAQVQRTMSEAGSITGFPEWPVLGNPVDGAVNVGLTPLITWTGSIDHLRLAGAGAFGDRQGETDLPFTLGATQAQVPAGMLRSGSVYVCEASRYGMDRGSVTSTRFIAGSADGTDYVAASPQTGRLGIISLDAAGNRYTSFRLSGQGRDVNPNTGISLINAGFGAGWLSRVNADGTFAWATVFGAGASVNGQAELMGNVVVGGTVYAVGRCQGSGLGFGNSGGSRSTPEGRIALLVVAVDAATGVPVTGFGDGGAAIIPVGLGIGEDGGGLPVVDAANRRMYLTATAGFAGRDTDAVVVAVNLDTGALVTGFDGDGIAQIGGLDHDETAINLALAGGMLYGVASVGPDAAWIWARDAATGAPVAAFGVDGVCAITADSKVQVDGLAVAGDRLVATGSADGELLAMGVVTGPGTLGVRRGFAAVVMLSDGTPVAIERLAEHTEWLLPTVAHGNLYLCGGKDLGMDERTGFIAARTLPGGTALAGFGSDGQIELSGAYADGLWYAIPSGSDLLVIGEAESNPVIFGLQSFATRGQPGQGDGVRMRISPQTGALVGVNESAPIFVNPPTTITAWAGTTVTLQVSVTGLPTPDLTWEKAEAETGTFATYTGPLSFTAGLADDGDQYRVTATNASGSIQHTIALDIQATTAPVFTNGSTSSVSVTAGDTLSLAAPVNGTPTPSVVWEKAEADTGSFAAYNGPFVFTASQADDGDQYRVTATNVAGSAQHLITVSVAAQSVTWSMATSWTQVTEGQTAQVQVNRSPSGPATSIAVVVSGPSELRDGTWPTSVTFADGAAQAVIQVPLADDAFSNDTSRQVQVTIQPNTGNLGLATTTIQVMDNDPTFARASVGVNRIREGTTIPTDPQVEVHVSVAPSQGYSFVRAAVVFPGTAEERPLRQYNDPNGNWGLNAWDLTGSNTLPLSQVNSVFPAGTYIIRGYVAGGGVVQAQRTMPEAGAITGFPEWPVLGNPVDGAVNVGLIPLITWTGTVNQLRLVEAGAFGDRRGDRELSFAQGATQVQVPAGMLRSGSAYICEAWRWGQDRGSVTRTRFIAGSANGTDYVAASPQTGHQGIISLDAAGNRYTSFRIIGQGRDANPNVGTHLINGGFGAGWLSRVNVDGSFAWAKVFGAGTSVNGQVELMGNIVVGGTVYAVGRCQGSRLGFGDSGGSRSTPGGRIALLVVAVDAATGVPVTGFGDGGAAIIPVGLGIGEDGGGLPVVDAANRRMYLTATAEFAGRANDAVVVAVNLDTGALETAFDGDGIAQIGGLGHDATAINLALSGGTLYGLASVGDNAAWIWARDAATGAPVTGFGDAGVCTITGDGRVKVDGLAIAGDRLVATGSSDGEQLTMGAATGPGTLGVRRCFAAMVMLSDGTPVAIERMVDHTDWMLPTVAHGNLYLCGSKELDNDDRTGFIAARTLPGGTALAGFGSDGLIELSGAYADGLWYAIPSGSDLLVIGEAESNPVIFGSQSFATRGQPGQGDGVRMRISPQTGALVGVNESAPIFVRQPLAVTSTVGTQVAFTVDVVGQQALQWQGRNGSLWSDLPGQTATTYNRTVQDGDQFRRFRCVASNSIGSTNSAEAWIVINVAPQITAQPQSQTALPGAQVILSVGANGAPAPTYQWRKDDSDLPGATAPSLFLIVDANTAGVYTVVVTNSAGSVTSSHANVTVSGTAPTVVVAAAPNPAKPGQTVMWTATVTGSPAPALVWQRFSSGSWLTIPGANGTMYQQPVGLPDDGLAIRCVATNALGSDEDAVSLSVIGVAPTVVVQPALHPTAATVDLGQPYTIKATLAGDPLPQAIWERRMSGTWVQIGFVPADENGEVKLLQPAVTAADDGAEFRLRAVNPSGETTSATFVLDVVVPQPVITRHPRDLTVLSGSTARFDVQFTSALPLAFQWEESTDGGVVWGELAGATTPQLALTNRLEATPARQYRCVLENGVGAPVTSNAAVLTVTMATTAPTLSWAATPPPSVSAGTLVTLTVTPAGVPLPGLQWWRNGVAMPGATAPSIAFLAQSADDNAIYRCTAANVAGSTHIETTLLVTGVAPSFTQQPADVTALHGGVAVFTARAVGVPKPLLQWKVNGVPVSGATGENYVRSNVTAADNGALVECVAVNIRGTTPSTVAMLTVNGSQPLLTIESSTVTKTAGQSLTLRVTPSGTPMPQLVWKRGVSGSEPVPIPGAIGPYLFIPAVRHTDNGVTFICEATNPVGTVSASCTLTVTVAAPTFVRQPQSQVVLVGGSAVFGVIVQGDPVPTLQWHRSADQGTTWSAIAGATGTELTLSNVAQSDDGALVRCVAQNGSTTESTAASLTVTTQEEAPAFVTAPQSQTVAHGASVTLMAAVTGVPTPTVTWLEGAEVRGTGPSLALVALIPTNASVVPHTRTIRCVADNGVGEAVTAEVVLTITGSEPTITTQPLDATAALDAFVEFRVQASGLPAPTFEWQRKLRDEGTFSLVRGAVGRTLAVKATSELRSSQWRCVVRNAAGSVTSSSATLTIVGDPAAIVTQPVDATVNAGSAASFTIVVAGSPAPTIAWQRSTDSGSTWNDVPGATQGTLLLPAVALALDGHRYRARVQNVFLTDPLVSAEVRLTVQPVAPAIRVQPRGAGVKAPATATFAVVASGLPAPTYQWSSSADGTTWTAIGGATAASYTTPATDVAQTGTQYRCVASNSAGEAVSQAAVLSVGAADVAPTFSEPSSAQTPSVTAGEAIDLVVAAGGTPQPTLQWFRGATAITGATGSVLSLDPADYADNGIVFTCQATNVAGTATSQPFTLTVAPVAPTITTQPEGFTKPASVPASLVVVAEGLPAPTYQWRKDGVDRPGATAATLSFTSLILTDAGVYECVVTNPGGTVVSDAVVVDVERTAYALTSSIIETATGNEVTPTPAILGLETGDLWEYRIDDWTTLTSDAELVIGRTYYLVGGATPTIIDGYATAPVTTAPAMELDAGWNALALPVENQININGYTMTPAQVVQPGPNQPANPDVSVWMVHPHTGQLMLVVPPTAGVFPSNTTTDTVPAGATLWVEGGIGGGLKSDAPNGDG